MYLLQFGHDFVIQSFHGRALGNLCRALLRSVAATLDLAAALAPLLCSWVWSCWCDMSLCVP